MRSFLALFAGRAGAIKGKFSQLEITRIQTTKAPAYPGMLPGLLMPREAQEVDAAPASSSTPQGRSGESPKKDKIRVKAKRIPAPTLEEGR